MTLIIGNLGVGIPVEAQEENAWVLIDVVDYPEKEAWKLANEHVAYNTDVTYSPSSFSAKTIYTGRTEGKKVNGEGVKLLADFSVPPKVIYKGQEVSLTLNLKATENTLSFYTFHGSAGADFHRTIDIGPNYGGGTYFKDVDGNHHWGIGGSYDSTSYNPIQKTIKAKAPIGQKTGDKMVLRQTFYRGVSMGTYYVYEWKAPAATPKPPPAPASSGNSAEAFESGSRIMWNPATGLGYRLFRSTSSTDLGISVTDFYITSTSYADVNVEPNTTYYYKVKPVLAEAKPFEGIDEKLGDTIATYVVKTGAEIYKPGSFKHFIMLKLESPNMSVDGINQEVDPGRGTTPLVIAGRTMVPIRAVVEAMGGTAEWDGNTKKITLKARGNTVEMWLGEKDIKVNGVSKKMDVATATKNNRTFVPVRFAAENLDCKVDWINSTKEVVIVYEE